MARRSSRFRSAASQRCSPSAAGGWPACWSSPSAARSSRPFTSSVTRASWPSSTRSCPRPFDGRPRPGPAMEAAARPADPAARWLAGVTIRAAVPSSSCACTSSLSGNGHERQQPAPGGAGTGAEMIDISQFAGLVSRDHGLAVIALALPDGTVHASVASAGVLSHPLAGIDAERLRLLLRQIFTAAGGSHEDFGAYDRAMAADRRAAILVTPERAYNH